jgi:hypothetical protein
MEPELERALSSLWAALEPIVRLEIWQYSESQLENVHCISLSHDIAVDLTVHQKDPYWLPLCFL